MAALTMGVDKCSPSATCLGTYELGEQFPASDGCNTCTCGAEGRFVCTERTCGADAGAPGTGPEAGPQDDAGFDGGADADVDDAGDDAGLDDAGDDAGLDDAAGPDAEADDAGATS
jgi:hypothetical protein